MSGEIGRIRRLSPDVARLVAAGEVIERPVSVVKELLENALDAGARTLRLLLQGGGTERIVLEDDGRGIPFEDLPLALERHATSKIAEAEDLTRVRTLGFRGEALASVAAVSRLEIRSRPEGEEGGRIRAEGGRAEEPERLPCARGTRIQVEDLFFNLPARRRFLRSPAGEARRVLQLVRDYALALPEIALTVLSEGRTLLALPASRSVEERIRALLDAGSERGIGVSGTVRARLYRVLGPETRFTPTVFVGRRRVEDGTVRAALAAAGLREGRLLVFLDLPPEEVDANIHPTKAEVRFRRPPQVFAAVRRAAEGVLGLRAGTVGEGTLFPGDEEVSLLGEADRPIRDRGSHLLGAEGDSLATFAEGPDPWEEEPEGGAGGPPPLSSGDPADALAEEDSRRGDSLRTASPGAFPERRLRRYLGRTGAGFLLFDDPAGVLFLDPHAAHERILYEALLRSARAGRSSAQRTILPRPLAPMTAALAADRREELEGMGFRLRREPEGRIALVGFPHIPGRAFSPEALLERALEVLASGEETGAAEGAESPRLARLARLACRDAVKITGSIGAEEAETLLADLAACRCPHACPHGRPTARLLRTEEIARWFERAPSFARREERTWAERRARSPCRP